MNMRVVTSTEAKNQFGKLLDDAKREPVMIQKNGRDQVVMISAEEYQALAGNASGGNPVIRELHRRSMQRRREVYEALAK